jgi:pilus assembly protein CpaF
MGNVSHALAEKLLINGVELKEIRKYAGNEFKI